MKTTGTNYSVSILFIVLFTLLQTLLTGTAGAACIATTTPSGTLGICSGGSLTINANTGTGLTYQWLKNGSKIAGKTASSLVVNAAGKYTVTVTDAAHSCSATSVPVSIVVTTGVPAISASGQPKAVWNCTAGSPAAYQVTATGGILTYQWQFGIHVGSTYYFKNCTNGTVYQGVTTATLNISNTTGMNDELFRCVVTNACGSTTSNGASIYTGLPAIASQPMNIEYPDPIIPAEINVLAYGAASYCWQKGTYSTSTGQYTWTNLSNGTIFSGVKTNTLSIAKAADQRQYHFRCLITNPCGQVTTNEVVIIVVLRQMASDNNMSTDDPASVQMNVFPNPAHGEITVKFTGAASTIYTINIMDLTGRIVRSEAFSAAEGVSQYSLDLSALTKGMYVLSLDHDSDRQTMRIVVQ